MRITVLLFAQLADLAGMRRLDLELDDGATASDAFDAVCSQHAELIPLRNRVALAVDDAYVGGDAVLADGAELALIPPVSGG